MPDDKHIERLTEKSKYHVNDACIVRHEKALNAACKYAINGYNATQGRKKDYNAPRYDNDLVTEKGVGKKPVNYVVKTIGKALVHPVYQPKTKKKGIWDVDKHGNFVPLDSGGNGFKYPYKHNWHHLIANEMLFQMLYDSTLYDPYALLELLLAGKYNLNGGENIVLLPQNAEVGVHVGWPIHPNNHPGFDDYASTHLSTLKTELKGKLKNKKVHQVRPRTVASVKTKLNKTSKFLYKVLEQMEGGKHINKIKEVKPSILSKLRKAVFGR